MAFIHCNHIWDEEGLTFHAKGIYCLLAKFVNTDGKCWPSVPTLVKKSKLSKPTVKKAINELKEAGFITVTQRTDSETNVDISNMYFMPKLVRGKEITPRGKEITPRGKEITGEGQGDFRGRGKEITPNYNTNNYSIELLGEKLVLDNLIELYKQHNPKAVKRFKTAGIAKARDTFQETIREKGIAPELLAQSITDNPEKPPWDIVRVADKPPSYDENAEYMDDFIARCQVDGFYTD